jgi:hypothetical protein
MYVSKILATCTLYNVSMYTSNLLFLVDFFPLSLNTVCGYLTSIQENVQISLNIPATDFLQNYFTQNLSVINYYVV